ncbi:MAG: hypothetical protein SOW25_06550 [Helicobacter sp.]|nr:hypothetical protein [Helicobacteraceae bacterium]MDY3113969.1 hypothetical protein [Helicobacter sp.]
MQQQNALKELTKRLDTIKEAWQIYAIFEEEKKKFNEEFKELKKDKEALIENFNETSAKNAMLLAQNKELESKNKALIAKNEALENTQNTDSNSFNQMPSLDSSLNIYTKELESLAQNSEKLQNLLKAMQNKFSNLESPQALQKLEVTYQKHQRLLANPAKEYVELESATALFSRLLELESLLKNFEVEFLKLNLEIKDLTQSLISQDSANNADSSTDFKES